MKKIFVTGATGFIGHELVKKLCLDYEVYALVRKNETKKMYDCTEVKIVQGDLENISSIEENINNIEFDLLYHLAWLGVSSDCKNNCELQMRNINLAFNAMELAHRHKCLHVVSTGSVSEYAYCEMPIDGTQLPAPCDMYSATKVAVRLYCELYAKQNGMQFNWILIPSIYGPGRNDNNLITYTIKSLLLGRKPLYTKLEQKWDYIYISDLVEALVLIGEKAVGNAIYPVGSGVARPLAEYVKIIKDNINPMAELGIGVMPYKTNTVDNAVVDIRKMMSETGYVPSVSFEEGIAKTIEYFRRTLG